MPAAVRIMADAVTGGDTKALTELMAKGGLNPNEALPKFFDILRSRSEGMLPQYLGTTRFAQGSFNKAVEDMMKIFSKTGGEQGFTNFFKNFEKGVRATEPLVRGLAGAFENLSIAFQAPVSLFKEVTDGLQAISKQTGISEGALTSLAGVGVLLATKWGRIGMMFMAIALVLEDLAYGIQGKDSYTKDIMDFFGVTGKNPNLSPFSGLANAGKSGATPAAQQAINAQMFGDSDRFKAISDPTSPYYKNPQAYDNARKQQSMDGIVTDKQSVVKIGDINVTINPQQLSPETDGQEIGEVVKNIVTNIFSQARSAFPSP